MKKRVKNYEVELSGSVLFVRKSGELVRALDVNPLFAIERYNEMISKLEAMAERGSL